MDGLTRVIVTGSRFWPAPHVVDAALARAWRSCGQPLVVVHGACPTGADQAAAAWVAEHASAGHVEERHPADWGRYGRAAGPLRNAEMVRLGAAVMLAFPFGPSRGTRTAMESAWTAGIPVVAAIPTDRPRESKHD